MSTDTSTDLRVGILGYGIGGQRFHAPLVAATPGLSVAVIVTSSPERADRARADYPGARVVPTADDLFTLADQLDLVVVSTPNRTHVQLALRAIEAGLPVVVDKPFAPTAADARQVVEAAARAGVGLTVFQNRRLDSDFLTVRGVLASGRLGEVYRFESRYDRWVPTPKENWREFGDPAEAGGLLYDLGAHIVDQALQLFGPVAQVYAELDRRRPGCGWTTTPSSRCGTSTGCVRTCGRRRSPAPATRASGCWATGPPSPSTGWTCRSHRCSPASGPVTRAGDRAGGERRGARGERHHRDGTDRDRPV